MSRPYDFDLACSPNDWKKFVETPYWNDLRKFLESEKAALEMELRICPDWEKVISTRAELEKVERFLQLPSILEELATETEKENA